MQNVSPDPHHRDEIKIINEKPKPQKKVKNKFLDDGRGDYLLNIQKIMKVENDPSHLDKVKSYLISNEVPCFKYNYSLDKIVQNFSNF